MTLISDLHQQWLKDPEYQAADEAQRPEFEIASAIIAAPSQANLTQKELTDDLTDWKEVEEMTESEIEASAKADPDCQPTDDDFWDDATVVKPNSHRVSQ